MKALIAGGGIGGVTAALCLLDAGIPHRCPVRQMAGLAVALVVYVGLRRA